MVWHENIRADLPMRSRKPYIDKRIMDGLMSKPRPSISCTYGEEDDCREAVIIDHSFCWMLAFRKRHLMI